MSKPVYLLVCDARWPLDADAAHVAREAELSVDAPVTTLRVPNGGSLYGFVPDGSGPVIIVAADGTSPVAPPVGTTRPVCWHERSGCDHAWNGSSASTIAEFLHPTTEPPDAARSWGWLSAVILVVGVVAGIVSLNVIARLCRHLVSARRTT